MMGGGAWLVLLLLGVLLVSALMRPVFGTRPAIPQPVAFNHLQHTEVLGLGCEFCHVYVRKGAHAGLPGAEVCAVCHATRQGTSDEAARVTELIEAEEPLQFNKLFRLPDHVFYTHRRHAGLGELDCSTCHGAIATTERPPDRPLIDITMDFCTKCHAELDQPLDCNACHR